MQNAGACDRSESISVKASPLAAGATSKNTDCRKGAGWDAHSSRALILLRPPGAVPAAGGSSHSEEEGHPPDRNKNQHDNAHSGKKISPRVFSSPRVFRLDAKDRSDGDARGRERAVEVLGRGRGGHACGLVLRDLRRHAGCSQPPASPVRLRSVPEARLHGTAERE